VLLYLFGSKDELVQEILARARRDQLELVAEVTLELRAEADAREDSGPAGDGLDDYRELVRRLWRWVAAPERCGTIRLFFEAYALSLRPIPALARLRRAIRPRLDRGTPWCAPSRLTGAGRRPRHPPPLALLRGLLLHQLAGGDPDHLEQALLAAL